ncbi:MAG: 2-amino-4-hydroxy-6-hydroxymethyldihydropteridine diphosphokinase [Muribaculaceae bacterium]
MVYYINIGTNLGNREANIAAAVNALERHTGAKPVCSEAVVSPPWGYKSSHEFMNIAVALTSDIEPHSMLHLLKSIEDEVGSSLHRNTRGEYCDRIIDLDIMAIDGMVIESPTLTVPHPHLAERSFFIEPFMQLAPQWRHPATHLSLGEMLRRLASQN